MIAGCELMNRFRSTIATLYDRSQYAVSLYQRGISNSNVPSCVHITSSELSCVELIGISDVNGLEGLFPLLQSSPSLPVFRRRRKTFPSSSAFS